MKKTKKEDTSNETLYMNTINSMPMPLSLHFTAAGGRELGCFFEKDGKLHFRGNVDESAEIFVSEIVRLVNSRLSST